MRSPMLHCPESLIRDRGLRVAWRCPGRLAFNCSPATRALSFGADQRPGPGVGLGMVGADDRRLLNHDRLRRLLGPTAATAPATPTWRAIAEMTPSLTSSRPAPWEMCGESEVGLSDRGPNVRASIA